MYPFEFKNVYGQAIEHYFADLSRIRITVFKEWPYLYQGSIKYERDYLQHYFNHERSLCILCLHDHQVVGISTLMPLAGEHDDLKKPLQDAGYDISKIFYYSESCLLKPFRGQGAYAEFFRRRQAHVNSFGADYERICFCSVVRPDEHPLKPADYRPLYDTWRNYGFEKVDDVQMSFLWQDLDQDVETRKFLDVWMKRV